jgi:hypothetical protein
VEACLQHAPYLREDGVSRCAQPGEHAQDDTDQLSLTPLTLTSIAQLCKLVGHAELEARRQPAGHRLGPRPAARPPLAA